MSTLDISNQLIIEVNIIASCNYYEKTFNKNKNSNINELQNLFHIQFTVKSIIHYSNTILLTFTYRAIKKISKYLYKRPKIIPLNKL